MSLCTHSTCVHIPDMYNILSLRCFRLPSYRPNVIRSIVLAGGRSIMARGSQKRQGPYSPAACTTREWGVLDRWRYFHMGVHTATTATTETRKFFVFLFILAPFPECSVFFFFFSSSPVDGDCRLSHGLASVSLSQPRAVKYRPDNRVRSTERHV